MQLAFCLYKYFPFGGLQRDFIRIARACQARGHAIRVYVLEWHGDIPPGFDVVTVPVRAIANHRLYRKFTSWVQADLAARPADCVVGFNKMPGLDVYYAADPCFEEKARTLRKPLYRYSPRYRHFSRYERAVFGPEAGTEILMISATQLPLFVRYYGTDPRRFHMLPPGIAPDRRAPPDADAIRLEARAAFGAEFGLAADDLLVVQIGSDFPRKGLDRTIAAIASLPGPLRRRTRLVAIGEDDPRPYRRSAQALGIGDQVFLPGGRNDVPRFLLGADLLTHPARHENTGTVLLEALVAGLPVLVSAACGYAHYIVDADAGKVVAEPFDQAALNDALATMLGDANARTRWRNNALAFADRTDLYSMPERAADIILETPS
ncbi:MAG TPA: glycosyltransferase family 4 protein [Rhodocyclaceae bacterium]|nr:glycosyltransferase family 4 protein [Rhodocyclaceae bacterium]HMV54552.1 glycosyltransferase family 4 protein [Rhodocyclaceae bacterium]HMZ84022.1 glycosyltransferase family 4 protein [Rhodocyclaceae bacterium]HNA03644.1 glycosyltransferase family 4 protein [Rhodocyclaceae bacterium]HNB80042.1 glycosyltransferase family 4 protein [Rhodocyclaceae bacterium]